MVTNIIVPSADSRRDAGTNTKQEDTSFFDNALCLHVLSGTIYANHPIVVGGGLIYPSTDDLFSADTSQDRSDASGVALARKLNAPRFLKAFGIILLDDLSEHDAALIGKRATIIKDFEIGLADPVSTSPMGTPSGDIPWHLETVLRQVRSPILTGAGVRIGMLDTGIDTSHSEFSGKHISYMEFDERGFRVSSQPQDFGDHGTHSAGIAAGSTCGIAPDADLAIAAVFTKPDRSGNRGTLSQILAGYNWLVNANHAAPGQPVSRCSIINSPLGGRGYNDELYDLIDTCLKSARSLLISAIGNTGQLGRDNHASPGNYDTVLGVGATDMTETVAEFSDWGFEPVHSVHKPDMSAPGVDILSCIPGDQYAKKSGTSMGAALVAGAGALIIQKYPQLAQNPRSLMIKLLKAVDVSPVNMSENRDREGDSRIGMGRLDLSRI
ncbi:MAG: S8 family serine peptidase [Hyphomonadaceae bacterium]